MDKISLTSLTEVGGGLHYTQKSFGAITFMEKVNKASLREEVIRV